MQTIKLSGELVNAYKESKMNISYVISELLGSADYDRCSSIVCAPMQHSDTVDYPIDSAAYSALMEKFDGLEDYGAVSEILLWSNYWLGANL